MNEGIESEMRSICGAKTNASMKKKTTKVRIQ
jgi:hypothetical protein